MAATAQGLSEAQKIELVLSQLESLPALSPVVARILAIAGDSSSSTRELISLIEGDPSLAASVLAMLGRADRGTRAGSATVATAVTMLGFKTIRHVALGVKVMEVFGSPASPTNGGQGFNRLEFWKHCLGVGCAARALAAAVGGWDPEEAFVCGLLHDMGKAAVAATMPKSADRIAQMADETHGDISEAERRLLGLDHALIGRRLAQRWGLPARIADCIWLHHQDPDALPPSVAAGWHVQIVQLADTLVRERHIGWSGNHRIAIGSSVLAAKLGLANEAIDAVGADLVDEIERRAEWVGLERLDGREMYVRALSESARELTSVNEVLAERNRRLEHTARYFEAMGWLSQTLSPRAAVREVCAAAAEGVCRALDVDAAVCVIADGRADWLGVGIAAHGRTESDAADAAATALFDADEADLAVKIALTGTWFAPPGPSFHALIERYRGRFENSAPMWLLPIVLERRWIGGVLLAADPQRVGDWHAESAQIEALVASLGLALAHARAQADALALGEELVEANRRSSAAAAEAFRSRTLETIVSIAAGAAHEMNNPLAVISGRAQMLRARAASDDDRRLLDSIVEQARACSDIATQLMEFAEPGPASAEPIELAPLLEKVRAGLIDGGILSTSDLVIDAGSDTPRVAFDRDRMARIFAELLTNSAAATDFSRRRLTIKARVDRTDKMVIVLVSDNGTGMAPEVLQRAMDPFFSHRPAGRGRGLGLARVNHWVRQSGGGIRIESRTGEGTLVELRLPIAEAEAAGD